MGEISRGSNESGPFSKEREMSLWKKAVMAGSALAIATGTGAVGHNAAEAASNRADEKDQVATELLLSNEQEISEQNVEYVKKNSEDAVYVVEAGDGKDDVLYATGWVGKKHQYGNTETDYTLDEIRGILQSLDENNDVDFDHLEPGKPIKIVKRATGE